MRDQWSPERPYLNTASYGLPPQVACEKMADLGTDAAVVNPLSVAGVHHGNDAHARYLTETVNVSAGDGGGDPRWAKLSELKFE